MKKMKQSTYYLLLSVIWGLSVAAWAAYVGKNTASGIVDCLPVVVGILSCVNVVLYARLYFRNRKKEREE